MKGDSMIIGTITIDISFTVKDEITLNELEAEIKKVLSNIHGVDKVYRIDSDFEKSED